MSDKIKRAARERQARTGEPYTMARRKVIEERELLVIQPGQRVKIGARWYTPAKQVLLEEVDAPPVPGEYFGDETL